MMIMVSPEKLRRFPFFAGLDGAVLKALAMEGAEIELKTGDWLFQEGDEADALYVILSGLIDLKITLGTKGVYCADLCTLVEGDVLGWSSLVEPHFYRTGAVASTDCWLIKLNGACVRQLMEKDPEIGYKLMSRLSKTLGERLTALRICYASLIEGRRWQRMDGQQPVQSPN